LHKAAIATKQSGILFLDCFAIARNDRYRFIAIGRQDINSSHRAM
jgi:hypothetical protein